MGSKRPSGSNTVVKTRFFSPILPPTLPKIATKKCFTLGFFLMRPYVWIGGYLLRFFTSMESSDGAPDGAARHRTLRCDAIPRISDALPQPKDRPQPLIMLERATGSTGTSACCTPDGTCSSEGGTAFLKRTNRPLSSRLAQVAPCLQVG